MERWARLFPCHPLISVDTKRKRKGGEGSSVGRAPKFPGGTTSGKELGLFGADGVRRRGRKRKKKKGKEKHSFAAGAADRSNRYPKKYF